MTIQDFAVSTFMTVEDASFLFGIAGVVAGYLIAEFMIWSVD